LAHAARDEVDEDFVVADSFAGFFEQHRIHGKLWDKTAGRKGLPSMTLKNTECPGVKSTTDSRV
jgi:hypothetical protein